MMNWKYTHIYHSYRRAVGLSLNAYAVLDIYYKYQSHPSTSKDGWTDVTFEEVAEFLGIGKTTVYDIVSEAVKSGYIERNEKRPRLRRTTAKWYNNAYVDDFKSSESEQMKSSESEQKSSESELTHQYKEKLNKPSSTHAHEAETEPDGFVLVEQAAKKVLKFLDDFPAQKESMIYTTGWNEGVHGSFNEEIVKWLFHSDNQQMLKNPERFVNKFGYWLTRAKTFNHGKAVNSQNKPISGKLIDADTAKRILARAMQKN